MQHGRFRFHLVLFALSGWGWSAASAAQEDDSDHGSRAAVGATPDRGKQPREAAPKLIEVSSHGAVFGGSFLEGDEAGVMLYAGLDAALTLGRQRGRASLDYRYDPFTTKTFNFSDEDPSGAAARLTQGLHELDAAFSWQGRWSNWLRTEATLSGDAWFPDNASDHRWSGRGDLGLRVGRQRGIYAEAEGGAFAKLYPRYSVAGRRIDQQGLRATLQSGYAWTPFSRLVAGHMLELTDYLDARYDALTADGTVQQAAADKSYLTGISFAAASVALAPELRLSLRYEHEANDSSNYARRVAAKDEANNDLVKFLPDYYDYTRERGTFKAQLAPYDRVSVSSLLEGWIRDFDSYEARDEADVWTGELRHDTSVELGGEVSFEVLDVEGWGFQHGLFLTAFGSRLWRRSNMRREVSLATTFDITRLFLGFELRPR